MSAPSRPVVVVLEGISAGQYFADAALKRGLEPVVVFPKLQTTPVYQIMRQSAIEFWKNKGCRVIEPENDKEETLLTTVKALNPIAIVSGTKQVPSEEGRFLLTKCKLFYPIPLRISSRWGYR